jgi:hypothetical protein
VPPIVCAIRKLAFLARRGHQEADMAESYDDENWERPAVTKAVKAWVTDMTAETFAAGGVAERFLFCYTVFMIAGAGKQSDEEWCDEAIHKTKQWLCHMMCVSELDIISSLQTNHAQIARNLMKICLVSDKPFSTNIQL